MTAAAFHLVVWASALLAAAVTSAQAPPGLTPALESRPRLLPVDGAATCAGFSEFRRDLLATIRRRDEAALLRVLHPEIRLSFGDDTGIAQFRQIWLSPAAEGNVWQLLHKVLSLGGQCDGQSFIAPYVYSHWPNERFDAFEYLAVTGDRVRLRAKASAAAPVVADLSHDIVRLLPGADFAAPWQPVELHDGRRGFVSSRYLHSPVGYRAFFARVEGRWLMTIFIAGD